MQYPINTTWGGVASTITSGYYKYGGATLIYGQYGTSGTCILQAIEHEQTFPSADKQRT